jgi:hypothetical protein
VLDEFAVRDALDERWAIMRDRRNKRIIHQKLPARPPARACRSSAVSARPRFAQGERHGWGLAHDWFVVEAALSSAAEPVA